MTDNFNEQTPAEEPAVQQPAEPTGSRPGWRERTLGLRGVAAVALASLILGGVGGAAVGVIATGDDDHADWRPGEFGRQGPPDGGHGGPPAMVPPDDARPDSSGGDTS